jgi:hypothetical protein
MVDSVNSPVRYQGFKEDRRRLRRGSGGTKDRPDPTYDMLYIKK